MKGVDFFNTVDHLEPKCPGCNIKVDWGVNTEYCEEKEAQICKECGAEIK